MNNFIMYYYNMHIDNVSFKNNYYYFTYLGYLYHLYIVDEEVNAHFLINLNKKLLTNTLVNEIIFNRDNKIISIYNNTRYILMKIYVNVNKRITLEEIVSLSNTLEISKIKINWGLLWSKKIDYLENMINENGKKYPIIRDSFNYFVGMAENAISYYNNTVTSNNYLYSIGHKKIRINDNIDVLYNPLNIIFDYKVRDLAEYIKISFFNDNKNIMNEINSYLRVNLLSITDIRLLISRLLYPSFYFDLYEDILVYNKDEKIILKIVDKLPEYEKYLANIISYFKNWYDIEEIIWLKNN